MPPRTEFPLAIDPRAWPYLILHGVRKRWALVVLDDDKLIAQFGPWRLSTEISNIARTTVTGPYRWYRAIGIRMSLVDRGLTFGSNARAGLCIEFVRPVQAFLPVRHPGLTVTVADPEGLKTAIENRHPPIRA